VGGGRDSVLGRDTSLTWGKETPLEHEGKRPIVRGAEAFIRGKGIVPPEITGGRREYSLGGEKGGRLMENPAGIGGREVFSGRKGGRGNTPSDFKRRGGGGVEKRATAKLCFEGHF